MDTKDDDLFIRRVRDRLEPQLDAPAPAAAMRRWQAALDHAARPEPVRRFDVGVHFAAAASVVLAVGGAAFLAYREDPATAVPAALASARVERGLQLHLIDLEAQLARVSDLSPADRAGTIRQLAQQNRLQTAVSERAGSTREARLLRAFTVALDQLAADPEANGRFQAALAQLDFELKVTQARLASSAPSTGALRAQAL